MRSARRFILMLLFSLVLWSSAPLCASEQPPLAVPVSGGPFAAKLLQVEDDWTIHFQVGGRKRLLAADELVYWGALSDSSRGPQVLLTDGGLLRADVIRIGEDHLVAAPALFGNAKLAMSSVQGVLLQPPPPPLARDQLLAQIRFASGAQDQLWLNWGAVVSGAIAGPASANTDQDLFGVQNVRIRTAGEEPSIPIDNIRAIVFNPALARPPQTPQAYTLMGFDDGSRLFVSSVSTQDSTVTITINNGVRLQADRSEIWQRVVSLQRFGPRVRYLSDLQPIGSSHEPFFQTDWPAYKKDQNALGGRLRSAGKLFEKGLGMHSLSRVAFQLPPGYRLFQTELALDDRAGLRGSVVYRVYLDDDGGAWRLAHTSDVVRGSQEPVRVSVDVTQASRIALVVDYADQGDVLDHANWLSARLVR